MLTCLPDLDTLIGTNCREWTTLSCPFNIRLDGDAIDILWMCECKRPTVQVARAKIIHRRCHNTPRLLGLYTTLSSSYNALLDWHYFTG